MGFLILINRRVCRYIRGDGFCLLARLFQQALLFEPCIFCLSFRLLCDAERGLLLSLGLGHGFRHFFEAIASARKFDPAKIRADQVARTGGAPSEE